MEAPIDQIPVYGRAGASLSYWRFFARTAEMATADFFV